MSILVQNPNKEFVTHQLVKKVCDNFAVLVKDACHIRDNYQLSYLKRDIANRFIRDDNIKISMVDAFILQCLFDLEDAIPKGEGRKSPIGGLFVSSMRLFLADSIGLRLGWYLLDDILSDGTSIGHPEGMANSTGSNDMYIGLPFTACKENGYPARIDRQRYYGIGRGPGAFYCNTTGLFDSQQAAHAGAFVKEMIFDKIQDPLGYPSAGYSFTLLIAAFPSLIRRLVIDGLWDDSFDDSPRLLTSIHSIYLLAGLKDKEDPKLALGAAEKEMLESLTAMLLVLREKLIMEGLFVRKGSSSNLRYYFKELQNRPYYRVIRCYMIPLMELEIYMSNYYNKSNVKNMMKSISDAYIAGDKRKGKEYKSDNLPGVPVPEVMAFSLPGNEGSFDIKLNVNGDPISLEKVVIDTHLENNTGQELEITRDVMDIIGKYEGIVLDNQTIEDLKQDVLSFVTSFVQRHSLQVEHSSSLSHILGLDPMSLGGFISSRS